MPLWNWQLENWPQFIYDPHSLDELEARFLFQSGKLLGLLQHFTKEDENQLVAELVGNESLKTSQIEGEHLQRDSIRSSILKHLGYKKFSGKLYQAENAIATIAMEAMEDLNRPIDDSLLFRWNKLLTLGRMDIENPGAYRIHKESIQIVSGDPLDPKIHFSGPPSYKIPQEMKIFLWWFNNSTAQGKVSLRPLARAGICHLHFLAIHPFEDGNGRIGRNLVRRVLSQYGGRSLLISLSQVICDERKKYYEAIQKTNTTLTIDDWLIYFSTIILKAMKLSTDVINFAIEKSKFFNRADKLINDRQKKVLLRMFQEGPLGFKGGLSADNYIKITKTSRATATRDLQDLVKKRLLLRQGQLKSTRYNLCL